MSAPERRAAENAGGVDPHLPEGLHQRRPVFALLTAAGISQVGNAMTIVAGPWFVLQTTGSAAAMGLVGAAFALGLLAPIVGGPLVDRLGFRRASVLADLASGITVAAIPTLHLLGVLQYWHLVVLVFVLTSITSQGDTGKLALVPALARLARMPVEALNARDRAVIRLGSVVGPLIAGFLIAGIGAVNVLFVDAATFACSALLIGLGVPGAVDRREPRPIEGGGGYLADLASGLRFVRSTGLLLPMILVATVGNLFDQPLLTVIAPIYAKEVYGSPASFGALVGAFSGGAFAGSLLFGAVGRRLPRRAVFLSSYMVGALIIYGTLALSPPLVGTIVAAVVAGLAFGPVNPIFATVTQQTTPPQLLGRVFGALTAIAQAPIPVGALLAGVVVQVAGLIPTIVGMGILYVGITAAMFLAPSLKGMDAPGAARDARAAGGGDRFHPGAGRPDVR
jgi:MFS family permease